MVKSGVEKERGHGNIESTVAVGGGKTASKQVQVMEQ